MANICSNHMHIEGNKEDIRPLAEAIRDQNPELLELFTWFEFTEGDYGLWEDTFTPEPESINLSFGSKWNFPFDAFNSLVATYPKLNFEAFWEEPGMQVFGKACADNDHDPLSYEILTPLDYYTEMNEDFAHERKCLTEMSYKEFISYVMDDWSDNDLFYGYLEEGIIKRINIKDLPLFIGKEWISENTIGIIESRLKGDK